MFIIAALIFLAFIVIGYYTAKAEQAYDEIADKIRADLARSNY